MEHRFTGPRYTLGIEEELMIVDSASFGLVSGINSILGEDPPSGEIKPEFLESVLEIATAPFWRGERTGLMSSRVPIFRAFPRVGLPPHYAGWEDYQRRVALLSDSGIIEDYTYLWYDVRPHPRLGTVEIRAMDSQTRVEHTIALAALVLSLVKLLVEDSPVGGAALDPPWEALDENRWLAARHGLDAELLDPQTARRSGVRELVSSLHERLVPHAEELGCARELEGIGEMLRSGNGALQQKMVYDANRDLRELMAEIVAASGA